jgi:hypothetical protein
MYDEAPPSPSSAVKEPLTDPDGWVYADNKWEMPSPKGGLGKYTRYRVWTRCAVLVEDIEELEDEEVETGPAGDKPLSPSNSEVSTASLPPSVQQPSEHKAHKHTLSEGGASMGAWRASGTSSSLSDRESRLTSRLKSVLEHKGGAKS